MATGENGETSADIVGGAMPVGGASDYARRLRASAHDLLALAASLERQSEPVPTEPQAISAPDDRQLAQMAREIYNNRRLRTKVFDDPDLFGEPAWDLLLDLFVAAREGKRLPVTSACIGAAVPTTTALRWIAMLEARGLVVRENDAHDARLVFVRLTEQADAHMWSYFTKAHATSRREGSAHPAPDKPAEGAASPFLLSK